MQCVVLAAGAGKRLQPITPQRSKAMAPVAGKPMVGRVIDMVQQAGVTDFLLVTAPEDQPLQLYVRTLQESGLSIRTVAQSERRGMAHALQYAQPFLTGDFVLTACDNLVPVAHLRALLAAHAERRAAATLSLMPVPPARISSSGIVAWDGERITRIVEKPRPEDAPSDLGSLPLYVFSPAILATLAHIAPSPRGEYELQDGIQQLIDDGEVVTGVQTDRRRQITTLDDLLELNRVFLDEDAACTIHGTAQLGRDIRLQAPLCIDAQVQIGDGCTIGPGVYLEARCHIGPGATVRNAIILAGAEIAAGSELTDTVVT